METQNYVMDVDKVCLAMDHQKALLAMFSVYLDAQAEGRCDGLSSAILNSYVSQLEDNSDLIRNELLREMDSRFSHIGPPLDPTE